jgi:hypothetical protein
MKHESKLTQKQQEQLAAEQQQMNSPSAREFASVEEMLRHDALHTPVPPTVASRLEASVKQLPLTSSKGWWRRFFGG